VPPILNVKFTVALELAAVAVLVLAAVLLLVLTCWPPCPSSPTREETPLRSSSVRALLWCVLTYVVFSDGGSGVITTKKGENPVYDPAKPGVVLGQSGSFSATQINDDLKWAVAYAKRRVPGIQIYAVGAGPAFVRSQLQLICDGDDTRVFASTAWSDILNFVSKLVARTCGVNPSPCTSCCGSCTCSRT
jgi:hypothetical protein